MRNNPAAIVKHVLTAIENSKLCRSKLSSDILSLEGMSGAKGRHLLNNIVYSESKYLEVGTWLGSTLCSALYQNNVREAISVDNFSQFQGTIDRLKSNVQRCLLPLPLTHINDDCFKINLQEHNIHDVDIYFYDGMHSWQNQYDAVKYFVAGMSTVFILIIDDWNGVAPDNVKEATMKAITDLQLTTHLYISLPDEVTLRTTPGSNSQEYWNGLGVFVLEQPKSA